MNVWLIVFPVVLVRSAAVMAVVEAAEHVSSGNRVTRSQGSANASPTASVLSVAPTAVVAPVEVVQQVRSASLGYASTMVANLIVLVRNAALMVAAVFVEVVLLARVVPTTVNVRVVVLRIVAASSVAMMVAAVFVVRVPLGRVVMQQAFV